MLKVRDAGFTLVELLVVISIIGTLASVVLAATTSVRMKARDSTRDQETRQYDLAVKLYADDHGTPPTLNGTCPWSRPINQSTVSDCVARSNDNSTAWTNFLIDIRNYIPGVPSDPCGAACPNNPGYVYVSPAALNFYSNLIHQNTLNIPTTDLYQMYGNHEIVSESTDLNRYGYKPFGDFYDPNDMYIQIITTRYDGTVIPDTSQDGTCVTNISIPPGVYSNTGSCIRSVKVRQPAAYVFTWVTGYPAGIINTTQIPTVSPGSAFTNPGVTTVTIHFSQP